MNNPQEVPIPEPIYRAIHAALRAKNLGPLASYGFFDMTIQPYDGFYSNPHPKGEPFTVRLIMENYHEDNRRNAAALASCEAWYLSPPD